VIGAITLSGSPLTPLSTTPTIVGSTVEIIGGQPTIAHDHDAQLVYSTQSNAFLLAWEVDGDSGEKEVVCNLVTPDLKTRADTFRVVGNASHPYDRKPAPVYSSFSNQFFVAYESGPNQQLTGIEGVAFEATALRRVVDPFPVSAAISNEHGPSVALSSNCGNIFALWTSNSDGLSSRHSTQTSPQTKKYPTSIFKTASAVVHVPEMRSEASIPFTTEPYPISSKFSLPAIEAAEERSATPHFYLSDLLLANVALVAATKATASSPSAKAPSSIQATRVCLPGRASCSALPTNTNASALGLVLGLLALVVVLAGMGGGGFVAWRRFPEIRAWWENRRNTAEGVWAEEDEFSISIDAFTSSEDTIGGEDDA